VDLHLHAARVQRVDGLAEPLRRHVPDRMVGNAIIAGPAQLRREGLHRAVDDDLHGA
jgi:hypothetical protein